MCKSINCNRDMGGSGVLTKNFRYVRVMHVWTGFQDLPTFVFSPHHECVHRSLDMWLVLTLPFLLPHHFSWRERENGALDVTSSGFTILSWETNLISRGRHLALSKQERNISLIVTHRSAYLFPLCLPLLYIPDLATLQFQNRIIYTRHTIQTGDYYTPFSVNAIIINAICILQYMLFIFF